MTYDELVEKVEYLEKRIEILEKIRDKYFPEKESHLGGKIPEEWIKPRDIRPGGIIRQEKKDKGIFKL